MNTIEQKQAPNMRVKLFHTAIDRVAELEAKLAALKGQEPVAWFNAKRDMTYMSNFNKDDIPLFLAAGAQPTKAEAKNACRLFGSDAPFTGTCGGGRDNQVALCYEAAPVQAQEQRKEQP